MQFSNDVRVELPLEPLDRAAFHTLMASMVSTSPMVHSNLHLIGVSRTPCQASKQAQDVNVTM